MNRIVVLLILLTFIVTGCGAAFDTPKVEQPEQTEKDLGKYVNKVSGAELLDKIDAKETLILVIGSKSCSYCEIYEESLIKLKEEEEAIVNYIDTDELSSEDEARLVIESLEKIGQDVSEGVPTPATYFITDGELTDEIMGAVEYEVLKKAYEDHIN